MHRTPNCESGSECESYETLNLLPLLARKSYLLLLYLFELKQILGKVLW